MYNLNGEWNVRIQFLSGEAQHSLRFEQEGAALSGTYRSQYGAKPLQGTVHGNGRYRQTFAMRARVWGIALKASSTGMKFRET
jgi:hypothetical protein